MILVYVHHADLADRYRSTWKQMLKRLTALARVQPSIRCIPAMGFSSYNGKQFNVMTEGGLGFVFSQPEEAAAAIRNMARIPGMRYLVGEGMVPFFKRSFRGNNWKSAEGALSALAVLKMEKQA